MTNSEDTSNSVLDGEEEEDDEEDDEDDSLSSPAKKNNNRNKKVRKEENGNSKDAVALDDGKCEALKSYLILSRLLRQPC